MLYLYCKYFLIKNFVNLEHFMKKKIGALMVAVSLLVPLSANAASTETLENPETSVTVFPATESTINGVPELELKIIHPRDVLVGPFFDSYNPTTNSINNKFKEIIQYDHDNTRNSTSATMSVSVQKSNAQGSEWGGNVEFTGEIRAGIMGGCEHKNRWII